MNDLFMVLDLASGDVFYTNEADIVGGPAFCVWVIPKDVTLSLGTSISGREVGYITNGALKVGRWREAKEVVIYNLQP